MKWAWRKDRDKTEAKAAEANDRAAKADEQVDVARREYERTVQRGQFLHDVVSVVFYHAEQNDIVEKFQKVVRGH